MKRSMEILAPVGSLEMLETAIANGANAVYFGLENFNARAKAENFNSNRIGTIIDRCHLFGVKAYITINTLVSDAEFAQVIEMVEKAHRAKADAFIVQDLGLIYVLKNLFPNIVIHASTQVGVCNEYGAKVLADLGVSRVVVARETTLEDIKRIAATGIEVEVFVQGALCVCYSGSCYLSSLLKNKSGNRGECLQLCRLPYKLVHNGQIQKNGYLLSTRDISLLSRLNELEKAGVCSLKIEGRLRRPAYLAQAIQSVKNVLQNQNNTEVETANMTKVFSRGEYNKGIFLDSKTVGGVINTQVNNHLGVQIGKVNNVKPFKDIFAIEISSSHKICKNDGLKFIFDGKEQSLGVGSVESKGNNTYVVFSKIQPIVGAKVYLTVDHHFENNLLGKTRKLKIFASVEAVAGHPLKLEFICGQTKIKVMGDNVEQATKLALSESQIAENISKLGDTPFEIEQIRVHTFNAFIPKSVINETRRRAVAELTAQILRDYEFQNCKTFLKNSQLESIKSNCECECNYYIVSNIEQLKVIDDKNAKIVYAPECYCFEDVECIKQCINNKFFTKLFLFLPVVANYKDLKVIDELLQKFSPDELGVLANSLYGLYFARQGYEVFCGPNMNIANTKSLFAVSKLGAIGGTSSIETQIFGHVDGAFEYVGKPTVMTLVMCPMIEHCGSNCKNCKYKSKMELVMDNNARFELRRHKVSDCYFDLISSKEKPRTKRLGCVVDLRS